MEKEKSAPAVKMQTEKDLVKYLKERKLPVFLLGCVLIIAGIYGFSMSYRVGPYIFRKSPMLCLFAVVFGALFLWYALFSKNELRPMIQTMKESGEMENLLSDFQKAQTQSEGYPLLVGDRYLFSKGSGRLVRYTDICQVRYVTKNSSRELIYIDNSGKQHTLCSLKQEQKSDEDARRLVSRILEKNPSVRVR